MAKFDKMAVMVKIGSTGMVPGKGCHQGLL